MERESGRSSTSQTRQRPKEKVTWTNEYFKLAYTPWVRVEIYSTYGSKEPYVFDSLSPSRVTSPANKGFGKYLKKVSVDKKLDSPAGSFEIHLTMDIVPQSEIKGAKRDLTWANIIEPNSFVRIFFGPYRRFDVDVKYEDRTLSPEMIGFVDVVTKESGMDPGSGSPSHSCVIRGRDFGKFLIKHKIIEDWVVLGRELQLQNIQHFSQGALARFRGGSSSFVPIIKFLVDRTFRLVFTQLQAFDGDDDNVSDDVKYFSINDRNNTQVRTMLHVLVKPPVLFPNIPYAFNLFSADQSLWTILQKIISDPYMEMYTITGGGKDISLSRGRGGGSRCRGIQGGAGQRMAALE